MALEDRTARGFDRSVDRLAMLMDAAHEELLDPQDPTRYTLAPRADELSVVYLDWTDCNENGVPSRKRATLQALLEKLKGDPVHATVTMVESKRADSRELLLKAIKGFDEKLSLLMLARNWQVEREAAQRLDTATVAQRMRDLLKRTLAPRMEEGLVAAMGFLKRPLAVEIARKMAAPLLSWIVDVMTAPREEIEE
jgi:hypothetical protein